MKATIEAIKISKLQMRKQLAALSFTEKVKILEKLRDRERAIAASGLRRKPLQESRDESKGSRKST